MTVPPEVPDGLPEDVPDAPSDATPPSTRPGVVPTIAAGCLGFVIFYIGGFALAIGVARADAIGGAIVAALIIGVAVFAVRNTGPGGRAILARVAIGVGIAALVFGGCLALLSTADFR